MQTMYKSEILTITAKDGFWKHADGRCLLIGADESRALVNAVEGCNTKDEAVSDVLLAIFAVMWEQAQR